MLLVYHMHCGTAAVAVKDSMQISMEQRRGFVADFDGTIFMSWLKLFGSRIRGVFVSVGADIAFQNYVATTADVYCAVAADRQRVAR